MTEEKKQKRKYFLIQWILYSSFGELLGFGFAALSGFLIATFMGFDEITMEVYPWIPVLVMVIAGFAEGYILGFVQSIPLHRNFNNIPRKKWMIVTAVGGAIAWGVGMSIGPLLGEMFFMDITISSIIVAFLMLVVLAGILGVAQWFELRKHFRDAGQWVVYTIVGWGIGLSVSIFGTSLIEESTPIIMTISISLISGFFMGALSSLVTGLYLINKL